MKDKVCVQIIFDDNWKKVVDPQAEYVPKFQSDLGNFRKEDVSVFERSNVITHWKPVVLFAKRILNIWCYLLVQRSSTGFWDFMLYSLLPKDSVEGVTAKLTLSSPLGCHADGRKYTFETNVLSYETTRDEAVSMGRCLRLQDSQVKPLEIAAEGTNRLFNYCIEVKADPKFLDEMTEFACVNRVPCIANSPNDNSAMVGVNVEDRNVSIIEIQ